MSSAKNLPTAALLALGLACSPARAPKPATVAPVTPEPAREAPDPEPFRAQQPAPGQAGAFVFPTPERVVLPNGLSVYLVRRPSRIAALSLWLRQGAAAVPVGKSGLAGLTARMLTEGTRKKSAAGLAEAVESLGTTLGADATRDASNLSLTCLPPDLPRALALLAEVTMKPAFSEAEFSRVRAEWLDGLRAERQEPQRLSSLVALRSLLGAPHGSPVDGSVPDVEKLGVRDLKEFHARAYTPDNAALIVVGPFEPSLVWEQATKNFGEWRGKSGVQPAPPVAAQVPAKLQLLLVDRPGAVQSAVTALQPLPKRSEAGYEARQLLGRALGGLFTSRLNLNLREEHAYTYGAFAQPVATQNWGALLVSTSVRTDVTAETVEQILLELRRMRDPKLGRPLSPDELGRASSDLIFNLGAAIEHPSKVAELTARVFVERLPLDYNARYPELLRGVPLASVSEAAQAITPEQQLVVIVGDRSKVEPALKQRGLEATLAPDSASE